MRSRRCRRSSRIVPARHDELLDGAALKADQKTDRRLLAREPRPPATRCGDAARRRRPSCTRIEWTVNELKAAGLKDAKVETYAVPGAMWVPQSWQLQVVGDPAFGAGTQTVTLQSAFPQPGGATIPGGSLTAPRRLRRARHRRGPRGTRSQRQDRRRARASGAVAVRRGRAGRRGEAGRERRRRRDQRDRGSGQRAVHRSALRLRQVAVLHDRRPGRAGSCSR